MSKFLDKWRATKRASAASAPIDLQSAADAAQDRARSPAPVAPQFPPEPACLACGEPSVMFLRGVPVGWREPDGVIVRKLGDFCSRECWWAVGK